MNKNLFLVALVFIINSCVGGGAGDEAQNSLNPSSNLTPINSLSELNGDYNFGQQENICVNYAAGKSASVLLTFNNNNLYLFEYGFQVEDCFGAPEYILKGTAMLLKSGNNELSITTVSETGKLLFDSMVTEANSSALCDRTNWVVDQEFDISGSSCGFWDESQFTWTDVHMNNGNITLTTSSGSTSILYPFKMKSIFSSWQKKNDSSYVANFYGQNSLIEFSTTIKSELSQEWIDILDLASRDTTGLFAGQIFSCDVNIVLENMGNLVSSADSFGYATVNSPNIDTPHYNACLEQDNDSTVSGFNYDEAHLYYTFGEKLFINYFGNSDGGAYLNDHWL